jgi:ADP-heptose:LPS heptosyltransferase
MDSVLGRLPAGARVAVIRLRSLGDCVLATPALALAKQARPDLQFAIVVEDRFAAVYTGNPAVTAILPPSLVAMAKWHPDLCVNLHGGPRSLRLTLASRAALRAGFKHFPFQAAYNLRVPEPRQILGISRTAHTAEHVASVMFWLGAPLSEIPAAKLFTSHPVARGNYAVLHPFASAPDKTWPAPHFIAVAEHLLRELGLDPVFIGAASDDLREFRRFRYLQGSSLESLKELLAGAALFVGNDSGPAHMAAAFGKPTVVLFGASDVDRWRPWRTESVVLYDPAGIRAIPPDRALQAVESLRFHPRPDSL